MSSKPNGERPYDVLAKPLARRKRDVQRPYPPDYVDRSTLAYRLDASLAKVDADVKAGLLPRPVLVGSLTRWRWADVEAHIEAANASNGEINAPVLNGDVDPFLEGARRVADSEA
jgi:predicted DNA-binding transcriptional regulator AlpA